MSGVGVLLLAETEPQAALSLPPQTNFAALHAAIREEIERGLRPEHAAIFARPVFQGGKIGWQAPGETARNLLELRTEDRRALLAATGSILSDIRRLGESGRAPTLARHWPQLRSVPGPDSVFAVDGRPVLAPWGHAQMPGATDVLAGCDDRVPFEAPVRTDWRPYGAALAAVVLLALLAGFALPAIARWAIPAPAQCRAEPGQLDLMRREAAAQARGEELKRLLANLSDEIGRKQLLCPIQTAQAPQPPPHADLPQQQWDAHDLSMLDGCWHNTTQLSLRDIGTGQVHSVREWKLCFDHVGNGRQTIQKDNGQNCEGLLGASFQGQQLVLNDKDRCQGEKFNLVRGKMECTRVNENEATCTRTDVEGPGAGLHATGKFIR